MKRFIALVFMLLPLVAMAQGPDFSKLTKRYAGNDNVTVMNISQQQLLAFMDDDDDLDMDMGFMSEADVENALNIKVVTVENDGFDLIEKIGR